MVTSKMKDKEYFNRIGALITSEEMIHELVDYFKQIEQIKKVEYQIGKIKKKETEEGSIIIFDYENINRNEISFLLEKKYEKKRDKKRDKKNRKINEEKNNLNDLQICSILSEKLFKDPLIIVFTIALKYWAIQRKLFRYDYVIRQNQKEMLDDRILLYLIYYFFMHKGLIEPLIDFQEEIKYEDKEDKDKDKKKDKDKDKLNLEDPVLLKKLGELFIEFFWFIHEIIKLTENEQIKDNTIWIDLGKKNYIREKLDYREIEGFGDRPNFKIPISLQLIYDNDRILCKIDKSQASFLKRECTRALYFLLNKDGEEMFVFEKKNN